LELILVYFNIRRWISVGLRGCDRGLYFVERRKKEEGRRKKEEGRRKKEEGRRKKEEGRKDPTTAQSRQDCLRRYKLGIIVVLVKQVL
jgi:hypothetical protein